MADHSAPESPSVEIDQVAEAALSLPGDDIIQDAKSQITRGITIDAAPEAIWPWLLQMSRTDSDHGYSILRSEPPYVLVLGSLYDYGARHYAAFDGPRPAQYWHATWALVLTPEAANRARLSVRSRVAFTTDAVQWAAVWLHPFNDFMEVEQLRRLKHSAEGRSSAG